MSDNSLKNIIEYFEDDSLYSLKDMLENYITNGGDINKKVGGNTLLTFLAGVDFEYEDKALELIDLIIDKADINIKNSINETALFIAIHSFNDAIALKLLEQSNINLNETFTPTKHTYLHEAVKNGELDVIKKLISSGADINAKDKDNNTPLIYSQKYKIVDATAYKNITQELLTAGANINAYNKENKSAYDYANIDNLEEELYSMLKPNVLPPTESLTTINNVNSLISLSTPNEDNDINSRYLAKLIEDISDGKLPTGKLFESKSPIKVFDPIEHEELDLKISDIKKDKEHIYFKSDKTYFRIQHEYINYLIKDFNSIIFECKTILERAPFIEDIEKSTPYFIIRSSGNYLIRFADLKAALKIKNVIFNLIKSKQIMYTTSFSSVVRAQKNGINYLGRQVNITNADHCQRGSDRYVYELQPLKLSNVKTRKGKKKIAKKKHTMRRHKH